MANDFQVVEKAIGPAIEVEERVAVWRMPATFSRDYQRIADYVKSQGAQVEGMPYAYYLDMDWDVELNRGKFSMLFSMLFKKWHFFAGWPTSKSLPGEGDLQSTEWGSHRYVSAMHRGPYKESSKTYRELISWAKDQGLSLKNEVFELYVNDPQEVGEANAETVILVPIQEN